MDKFHCINTSSKKKPSQHSSYRIYQYQKSRLVNVSLRVTQSKLKKKKGLETNLFKYVKEDMNKLLNNFKGT